MEQLPRYSKRITYSNGSNFLDTGIGRKETFDLLYLILFNFSKLVFGYLAEFWKHAVYTIFPLWTIHLPIEEKPQIKFITFPISLFHCPYLGHLLSVGLGIEWSLGEQDGMFLGSDTQLVVEGVVPDLLHVVPVGDDAVFDGVLQGEDT